MDRKRLRGPALAAILAVAGLGAGCTASPQTAHSSGTLSTPGPSSAVTPVPGVSAPAGQTRPGPSAAPLGGRGGRGGSGNGSPAAAGQTLPADWPPDLPVPAGSISGSTGSAGRWTVLILASGSAADVRRSASAVYTAAGFTAVTDSVLNKGNRQITLVVENRDHSATQTNLMIGVTTR